jgi:glycosyltransferase involved in cell wall biosynthesis
MQDLFIVMPVYNEQSCIQAVVDSWLAQLSHLGLRHTLCVLNDGSTDGTARILKDYGTSIELVEKPNSGHGPTLLAGYSRGVRRAEWVFQTDSDGEIGPESFSDLWERRGQRDAVIGTRTGRPGPPARQMLSLASRLLVHALFGAAVTDVNCPFRLMRSEVLASLLDSIPPDTFAPNVLLSAALCSRHYRVENVPVASHPRLAGQSSLGSRRLVASALLALSQTLRYRLR